VTDETPTPQPRTYGTFLIRLPDRDTLYEPTEPSDNLLDAVVNCGIIPGDIKIYYLTEVPSDIRKQALGIWSDRIEAEVQQIRAAALLREQEGNVTGEAVAGEPTPEQVIDQVALDDLSRAQALLAYDKPQVALADQDQTADQPTSDPATDQTTDETVLSLQQADPVTQSAPISDHTIELDADGTENE
jgi:hypothetical protein